MHSSARNKIMILWVAKVRSTFSGFSICKFLKKWNSTKMSPCILYAYKVYAAYKQELIFTFCKVKSFSDRCCLSRNGIKVVLLICFLMIWGFIIFREIRFFRFLPRFVRATHRVIHIEIILQFCTTCLKTTRIACPENAQRTVIICLMAWTEKN